MFATPAANSAGQTQHSDRDKASPIHIEENKTDPMMQSLVTDYNHKESIEHKFRRLQQKFLKTTRKMIGDINKSDISRKIRMKREALRREIEELPKIEVAQHETDSEKSMYYRRGPPELTNITEIKTPHGDTKTERQLVRSMLDDIQEYQDIIMSIFER